jgi:hypothetical protein
MAVEAKRGCGYRKVGGLYMVCNEEGRKCGRLPLQLDACQTCGGGVRQTRGFTWINPSRLFATTKCFTRLFNCAGCPADTIDSMDRAGLIWIGKAHYKTPAHFSLEATNMGISRRIPAVPRGFVVGKNWVFLAHPEVVPGINEEGDEVLMPAVFTIFRPTAIELIVTDTEMEDDEKMDRIIARGITPIAVPDDDEDHRGTTDDDD